MDTILEQRSRRSCSFRNTRISISIRLHTFRITNPDKRTSLFTILCLSSFDQRHAINYFSSGCVLLCRLTTAANLPSLHQGMQYRLSSCCRPTATPAEAGVQADKGRRSRCRSTRTTGSNAATTDEPWILDCGRSGKKRRLEG
jgi:hypothetical protein